MAARFVFLAARAVWRDILKLPAEARPAMYAYDRLDGRLAISTRSYNCARDVTDQRRLSLGGSTCAGSPMPTSPRVAASIGGTGSANFGVIVAANGRGVVASATPRTRSGPPR